MAEFSDCRRDHISLSSYLVFCGSQFYRNLRKYYVNNPLTPAELQ